MVQVANIASLNLVKAEVDATLVLVQGALEAFVENRSDASPYQTALAGLEQIWGAMRLADLAGAVELSSVLLETIRRTQNAPDDVSEEILAALGNGVMVLGRYLEYVQIKEVAWPQLLMPAINQLRRANQQTSISESQFLHVEAPVEAPALPALRLQADERRRLLGRLRLMYQTGLLGLVRDDIDAAHYHLMGRALYRLRQYVGPQPLAGLLWVAEAAVEALANGVAVNLTRKMLLGKVDRQLRLLQQEGETFCHREPDRDLLVGLLYLVGLADQGKAVTEVRAAYALEAKTLSVNQMMEEYELMCGPGGSVILTVSSVLKEEVAHIKDALDLISRGAHVEGGGMALAEQMTRVAQTLLMLGLSDISALIKRWAEQVQGWGLTPPEEELHGLVDALLGVDNAVAGLVKGVTPGMETPVINTRISIYQLDEARAMLVAESRSGLSLAKRAVTSYLEANHDRMHLTNVPSTLHSVAGGLSFLGIPRGTEVLQSAANYIERRLLQSDELPSMQAMETLADAISSIDYYLESLEANKPIGEGVLMIAEDSMAELGFPVARRRAA